ncbi:hypothetical protein LTR56_026410 [Elasticomyces elasticus]|nr:hypothetical protein LTR56_026410 [Elasticomyces elasticus]KAK3618066.1 hypothetical protein LTR22_026503 [Elasticomyces elasticus]KAK4902417.1 hypothetical protein LTR49_027064 [Elasticomyces elasticus]KAK5736758.1 hypothetical protein LTS12_026096 [Elasticomyces elasticus]
MAAEVTVIQSTESTIELASTRVFATTELLEHVLAYVPARDVLLAQRVSQSWQAVIKKSPSLQKLLLFTGQVVDPAIWMTQHPTADDSGKACFWDGLFVRYTDSPLGHTNVAPNFPEWRDVLKTGDWANLHIDEPLARLVARKPIMFVWPGDDHASPIPDHPTQLGCNLLHEPAMRPEASWRHMLQLNPATIGNVSVSNTTLVNSDEGLYARAVAAAGGNGCIRFGKLWDAAVEARRGSDQARRERAEARRLEGGSVVISLEALLAMGLA